VEAQLRTRGTDLAHATHVTFAATVIGPDSIGPHEIRVIAHTAGDSPGFESVPIIGAILGPPAFTPAASLQVIGATNPTPPSGDAWPYEIVFNNRVTDSETLGSVQGLAAFHNGGWDYPICSREWNQVTEPGEDYDDESVAFSGWLLDPDRSGADVPFTHPFGNDWEGMVALDDNYTGLLGSGNVVPDSDGQIAKVQAPKLGITVPEGGFLGVETDQRCVPADLDPYSGNIVAGDRIAVLGRWIVDAGHSVTLPGSEQKSYRTEVHPPLVMAIGGTRTGESGELITRILLTSRPFLVKQLFTTDINTIWDDSAPDDGPVLVHFTHELDKLHTFIPDSLSIEAHPKIAAKPFRGEHSIHMQVRPPAPASRHVAPVEEIEVKFQFTHRDGVDVQVVGTEYGVDLLLDLNSEEYPAPHHPDLGTRWPSAHELGPAQNLIYLEMLTSLIPSQVLESGGVSTATAEIALANGIETDYYQVPDVKVLDGGHQVGFVSVGQIPSGEGVILDNDQPYPVYGFLELRFHRPDTFTGGPVSNTPHEVSSSGNAVVRDDRNPKPSIDGPVVRDR
jgi:hypothetical protein